MKRKNKVFSIGLIIEAIGAAVLIYGSSDEKISTIAFTLFGIGLVLIIAGIAVDEIREQKKNRKK